MTLIAGNVSDKPAESQGTQEELQVTSSSSSPFPWYSVWRQATDTHVCYDISILFFLIKLIFLFYNNILIKQLIVHNATLCLLFSKYFPAETLDVHWVSGCYQGPHHLLHFPPPHACMHLCMRVHVEPCMCAFMYMCTCGVMHVCNYVCVHVESCMCMHSCMCMCTCGVVHVYIHVCVYMWSHMCAFVYCVHVASCMCMPLCMCVHVAPCLCAFVYVCVHVTPCTCAFVYAYLHVASCMCAFVYACVHVEAKEQL